MTVPIRDKPLVERVYDAILDEICEGRLSPGVRIRQEDLAADLDVSRQPIIQALGLLKAQGFVAPYGRKGLKVAELDPDMVVNLYEVRSALERLAVARAAGSASPTLRAEGEAAISDGWQAIADNSARGLIAADLRFHSALWTAAGNPMIAEMLGGYWAHLRWAMRNILQIEGYAQQVQREHAAILEAVMTGDTAHAEQLLTQHLNAAAETVAHELQAQKSRGEAA